ncbi:MAG TPA: type II toxin-antitoxin system VapC family toxin [Solirubrobacteraceae bacterium]|jgi:PIN domain nuclease of toxin-antitoxin system|nr:type II toxin-antitoxin system VapC family toxin [Solirubrobacteraceae bacterium]
MIVLDTHAWLWWMADPVRLSDPAREALAQTSSIGVCTLSAWELAMLVIRGRITLDRDISVWVRRALDAHRVEPLAPGADVAVAAGLLDADSFPGDPIDRLIYATARSLDARLVTRDRAIRAFDPTTTIW